MNEKVDDDCLSEGAIAGSALSEDAIAGNAISEDAIAGSALSKDAISGSAPSCSRKIAGSKQGYATVSPLLHSVQ